MGCGSSMQPVECEGYMHDHARPKFSAECEAEKDLDPERFAKLFKSYDKDQDGLLSPAECSDIMVPRGPACGGPTAARATCPIPLRLLCAGARSRRVRHLL